MFGTFPLAACASSLASPPNRLDDSRPDPGGAGGVFSFARVGFGEGALHGASGEALLGHEGLLAIGVALGESISISDGGTICEVEVKFRI